jgi:hypothetical protein
MKSLQINNYVQLSPLIIVYEIIFLIIYFTLKIDKQFISWPLFINIFIILVVLFCDCGLSFWTKFIIILIKCIFLVILLLIVDFSLRDYIIGVCVLILYYVLSNINNIYNCDVELMCLINSFVISSIIYLYNTFLT